MEKLDTLLEAGIPRVPLEERVIEMPASSSSYAKLINQDLDGTPKFDSGDEADIELQRILTGVIESR